MLKLYVSTTLWLCLAQKILGFSKEEIMFWPQIPSFGATVSAGNSPVFLFAGLK